MKFHGKLLRIILVVVVCSLLTYANATEAKSKVIVFLGDSLTEGYQLGPEEAYPYLIQEKLNKLKLPVKVINSGVSGSTTASAMNRYNWIIKNKPDVLFLALGANDGLRGFKPETTYTNLEKIILQSKKDGILVVLAGMQMPPNYGAKFTKEFKEVFTDLAKKHKLIFVPFLLEGVATKRELNLPDGIHPNADGHKIMAETAFKAILPVLQK